MLFGRCGLLACTLALNSCFYTYEGIPKVADTAGLPPKPQFEKCYLTNLPESVAGKIVGSLLLVLFPPFWPVALLPSPIDSFQGLT